MRIEITTESGKWIRADLVDSGSRVSNLHHTFIYPDYPLMEQYQDVVRAVKFNFPNYSNITIVTDIGASGSL